MVPQDLEHPAIRRSPAAALVDHALQLGAERFQARHASLDLAELPAGDRICLVAGLFRMVAEIKELVDRVKRETELPRMTDER